MDIFQQKDKVDYDDKQGENETEIEKKKKERLGIRDKLKITSFIRKFIHIFK